MRPECPLPTKVIPIVAISSPKKNIITDNFIHGPNKDLNGKRERERLSQKNVRRNNNKNSCLNVTQIGNTFLCDGDDD